MVEKPNSSVERDPIHETKLFINIFIPNMLTNLLTQVWWLISSSYAGKNVGPEAVAAISVTMLGSMLGRFIVFGLLSSYDTLAGNAMGERNYSEVGFLFQSTLGCVALLSIPVAFFFCRAGDLFTYLGQPAEVIEIASEFLDYYVLIFPIETSFLCIQSFYRAQNITLPFLWITLVSTFAHYFYVHTFKHIMKAYLLTHSTSLLQILLFFQFRRHKPETLTEWSLSEAFAYDRIKRLWKLGLPGIFGMSDWFFYEFQTILAGRLGAVSLEAHAIVNFILPLPFYFTYAIGTAAQTRIATVIGERDVTFSHFLAKITIIICMSVGVLFALAFRAMRDRIFVFFLTGDDEDVKDLLIRLWPYTAAFIILDCSLGANEGVLKGFGEHYVMARIIFHSLWIVGIPLELLMLQFVKRDLISLWIGLFLAFLLMDSCLFYKIHRTIQAHQYQRLPQSEKTVETKGIEFA